jgi:hypothetical protein
MDISLNEDRVKGMAARLRSAFEFKTLSQSKSLEVVAGLLGYPNWDTLSGMLKGERQPGFRLAEPVELYIEAHAIDEYGDSPPFASLKVTQEWVEDLLELQALCIHKRLGYIAVDGGPDEWKDDEQYRMRDDWLIVDSSSFWFDAHPKHANYSVQTETVNIEQLIAALGLREETADLLWYERRLVSGSTVLNLLLDSGVFDQVYDGSDTDHE